MTYDLTAKVQDVIAEIAALKTEQQTTNAKLDLLIAKDVTITGDVIADMTGIETRLDALKLALVGASTDPTDIRQAIWNLAGPAPGKSLADIHAALIGTDADPTDIRAAIWGLAGPAPGTTLTQLWAKLDAIHGALGFSGLGNPSLRQLLEWQLGSYATGMQLYNIIDQLGINAAFLDTINTAIGGSPYQSLELTSVRGLLNALRQCACAKNDGPPLIGDDAVCSNPYESESMMVLPWALIGGTSVMFAVFPDDPPSGIEFGDTFGIGEDHGELESDDWDGWRVWVASEAEQFAMDSGVNRYPTNEWVEMSGSGSRAFSVDALHGLSVTLCGAGSNWEELSNGGHYVSYRYIVWPTTWPRHASDPWAHIFLDLPGGQSLEIKTDYSSVEVQPTGEAAILIPVGGTGITVTGPKELTVGRPQGLGDYTVRARLV